MRYDLSNQTPVLAHFYVEYFEWVSQGAVESRESPFSRRHGLCGNLEGWCALRRYTRLASYTTYAELMQHLVQARPRSDFTREMNAQFKDAQLCPLNPFGDIFSIDELHHLNVRRIDWVAAHIPPTLVQSRSEVFQALWHERMGTSP